MMTTFGALMYIGIYLMLIGGMIWLGIWQAKEIINDRRERKGRR